MDEETKTVEEVKDETVDTQQETNSTEKKTFTQAEVDKLIEERVKRATKKAEDNAKKQFDEAEKLRKMNAEEKAKYEAEKKDKEIADLRAQLNRQGLEKEAATMLSEKGLPVKEEVLAYVVRDNAEETQTAVNGFATLINLVADEKVKEMLKGKTPKQMPATTETVSKEQFQKMGYNERQELYDSNPDLYNELTK